MQLANLHSYFGLAFSLGKTMWIKCIDCFQMLSCCVSLQILYNISVTDTGEFHYDIATSPQCSQTYQLLVMMTSWYRNSFHITGLLWGNHKQGGLFLFLCCHSEQAVEQSLILLVIRNATLLIWVHFCDVRLHHLVPTAYTCSTYIIPHGYGHHIYPDSKVHRANMGPIWGWQDPGGPHVGPMNFAIWVIIHSLTLAKGHIWPISDCPCLHISQQLCIMPCAGSFEQRNQS